MNRKAIHAALRAALGAVATAAASFLAAGAASAAEAPTGLAVAAIDYTQAACDIDCSARLSWTAPASGSPTGYNVYRRIAASENPTLAGSVDGATTTFTDMTATVAKPTFTRLRPSMRAGRARNRPPFHIARSRMSRRRPTAHGLILGLLQAGGVFRSPI